MVDHPGSLPLVQVKAWRISRGLSQARFAERAGLKYKHYQQLEAGRKREFHFSTFLKLAKACELDPWKLLHPEAMAAVIAEGANGASELSRVPRRKPALHAKAVKRAEEDSRPSSS